MKIAHITPSSGGNFYCENCLRDSALVSAMHKAGQDIYTVPMYLPIDVEKDQLPIKAPIFFGGINVYLQQKFALFRKTPRWLDSLLDFPGLLKLAGKKAGMTSAKELAETTISMLRGEHGFQIKELNRLIDWLALEENKPDLATLSNVLLIGLAGPLKEKIDIPVVCLLQDEDGFLDGLGSPYAAQAWNIVAEQSKHVDLYISVSQYFSDLMRQRLRLEADKIEVVYMGIPLDGYKERQAMPEVPTIGYLSRMCPERGLDTLVDAYILLKKKENLKHLKLRIAGGKNSGDEDFINTMKRKLSSGGVIEDVEFLHDFDSRARHEFLSSLTILSVPEKGPVAYGLYVLEALAAGVSVVEPAIGVFNELIEMTGGGVLYKQNNAEGLAAAAEPLLLDNKYAQELGEQGKKAMSEKLSIEKTAAEMTRIYEQLAG